MELMESLKSTDSTARATLLEVCIIVHTGFNDSESLSYRGRGAAPCRIETTLVVSRSYVLMPMTPIQGWPWSDAGDQND